MISFFKNFGKGVLYVLVLPALLAGLAVYAVVALFVFIYLAIKGLILFFTGRSLYEDLPEDKEAKRILGGNKDTSTDEIHEETNEPQTQDSGAVVEPTSSDPFYIPEYLKQHEEQEEMVEEESIEETPREETQQEENNTSFEEPVEPEIHHSIEVENEEEKIEEMPVLQSKSKQNSNILDISELEDVDDSDEENTGSGINIDFD